MSIRFSGESSAGRKELHFSSMASSKHKGHSLHGPPFVDFLKPAFTFVKRMDAPTLRGKA